MDLLAFWFSNAVFAILTDVALCIMPMHVLWKLRLPRRQKYGLIVAFALGGTPGIVAILRITSMDLKEISRDPTYELAGIAVYTSIELNMCIICGCLPALRPLIHRLWRSLLRSGKRAKKCHNAPVCLDRRVNKEMDQTSLTAVQFSQADSHDVSNKDRSKITEPERGMEAGP